MKRNNKNHRGLVRIEGYHDNTSLGARTIRVDDIVVRETGRNNDYSSRLRFNDTKLIRTQMIGMISGVFEETYQRNKQKIEELIEAESRYAEQHARSAPLGNDDVTCYRYKSSGTAGRGSIISCLGRLALVSTRYPGSVYPGSVKFLIGKCKIHANQDTILELLRTS